MQIPDSVLKYVEPTALRHSLIRDKVSIVRVIARPNTQYNLSEQFRLRCVFFHLPKTGGLAVSDALFGNRASGHISVEDAKLAFGAWRFRWFFKFCFVRNPWDRLVSAYHYLRKGHPKSPIVPLLQAGSFAEFVANHLNTPVVAREEHIRPQHSYVTDSAGRLVVDFVGRFERLAHDYDVVARRLGVNRPLTTTNRSDHDDYRRYYDAATQARVAEFYRKDIELFDYRFDC